MKIRMRRLKTGPKNHAMFEIPESALEWYHKLIGKGNAMGDWYDVTIALPKRTRSTGDRFPQSESIASVGDCVLLIESAHLLAADLDIRLVENENI